MAILSGDQNAILDAKFSLNGSLIAVAGDEGVATVFDGRTFATLYTLTGHEDEISEVNANVYR